MRRQYGGEGSGCCQRGESLQDRPLRAQAYQCRGGLNDAPGFSPVQIPSTPSNRTAAGGHLVIDQNRVPQGDFPRFDPRLTLTRPKLLTTVLRPPCCPLGVHNCMLDLPRGVGVEHTTCSSASKGNQ